MNHSAGDAIDGPGAAIARTHPSTLPLSPRDRKVLARRAGLLGILTKGVCLAGAAGFGIIVAKNVVARGAADFDDLRPLLHFAVLFFGPVLLADRLLAWWERTSMALIRSDLALGYKLSMCGTLRSITDSDMESSPTYFVVQDEATGASESFALRTLSDLWRIRLDGIEGSAVTIEFAPGSRIVLQLQKREPGADEMVAMAPVTPVTPPGAATTTGP